MNKLIQFKILSIITNFVFIILIVFNVSIAQNAFPEGFA